MNEVNVKESNVNRQCRRHCFDFEEINLHAQLASITVESIERQTETRQTETETLAAISQKEESEGDRDNFS